MNYIKQGEYLCVCYLNFLWCDFFIYFFCPFIHQGIKWFLFPNVNSSLPHPPSIPFSLCLTQKKPWASSIHTRHVNDPLIENIKRYNQLVFNKENGSEIQRPSWSKPLQLSHSFFTQYLFKIIYPILQSSLFSWQFWVRNIVPCPHLWNLIR